MKISPKISRRGQWDIDYKEKQTEESFRMPKAHFYVNRLVYATLKANLTLQVTDL